MENEVKEISMEELKGIMADGFKELAVQLKTDILKDVKSTQKDLVGDTDGEKVEKSAKFIRSVLTGDRGELKAVDSGDSSFGYTVPTELSNFILSKRDKISKMRKYAFVFQMAGNFQLPVEGTAVVAYWVGENEEITESNPTTTKKDLVDYYLATRVLIPRKLLNTSAFNLINYIGELCSRKLKATEETAFVAGDGSSKPTGLRVAAISSVAQAGATLVYDDVVNLFYSLSEQYREGAVFMTSASGMKSLRKIKDDNGVPIFDTRDQKIFNRLVIESEDIPSNLGTGTDETEIFLGDLWYYWIKDGESMFVDSDKIISKLQIELVVGEAIDGVLTNPEAFYKLTAVK